MSTVPSGVRDDSLPTRTSGRRAGNRYSGNSIQAFLTRDAEDYVWPVRVRDIGADGVSLILNHGMVLDTVALLKLYNPVPNFSCTVRIQVVYVIKQADGRFLVGCTLNRELSEEELKLLV